MTLLYIVLGIILLVAVIIDCTWRVIPNWLTLPGILLGLVISFWLFGTAGLLEHFLGMTISGGVWFIFWRGGWMGGGDQKLMALVGSFLGSSLVTSLLFLVAVSGGLQAGIWLLVGKITTVRSWQTLMRETNIPYSLAIATGTALTLFFFQFSHVSL